MTGCDIRWCNALEVFGRVAQVLAQGECPDLSQNTHSEGFVTEIFRKFAFDERGIRFEWLEALKQRVSDESFGRFAINDARRPSKFQSFRSTNLKYLRLVDTTVGAMGGTRFYFRIEPCNNPFQKVSEEEALGHEVELREAVLIS